MIKLSRKARIIAAIVCAVVLIVSAFTIVIYRNIGSEALAIIKSSKTADEVDEIFSKKYSRNEPLSKACKAANGVWVFESELSEKSKPAYTLSDVCSDVFDTVFLSCAYLTASDEVLKAKAAAQGAFDADYEPDEDKLDDISEMAQILRDAGKSVVTSLHINSLNSLVEQAARLDNISGIILQGLDSGDESACAERLGQVYSIIKGVDEELTVYADIPYKWMDFSAVADGCMDVLYSEINCDVDRISATMADYSEYSYSDCSKADVFDAWAAYWSRRAKESSLGLYIGYRADLAGSEEYAQHVDVTLIQTILSDTCPVLGGRVYRSYKSVVANKDNCMGAVKSFITKGLNIDLACRRLSIVGYSREIVQTGSGSAEFVIRCSNVFPLYVGGKSYGIQRSGEYTVVSNLATGLNFYKISQNGTTIIYKIKYTPSAASPLLTFIVPDSELQLDGGEMLDITVGGHITAEVTATVGGKTVNLQRDAESYGAYTTYRASIRMPDAAEIRQDLGQIVLVAKADGVEDETYKGAKITVNAKAEPETTSGEEQTAVPHTTLQSDNEVLSTTQIFTTGNIGSSYGGTASQTQATQYKPLDKSAVSKVCMITAKSAEARPVTPLSNTYIPTFTPLPEGTLDTITDVVEYNDGDDTIQYYVLQSGRRVMIKDASVLDSCTLSENSVEIKSSTTASGASELLLTTKWKVPYNVNLSPQSYSSGYEGKLYNVSSFTADKMEITFWYTPSAFGSADFSSSDIISSCSWSSDSAAKKSTLTLNFKNPGKFYGYSIGYNDGGDLSIKISNRVGRLAGSVIMIDPGHGGRDVGALSPNGAIYESSLNLYISQLLANYLSVRGATVYMTRNDNSHVSLEQRRSQSELVSPDLFISIHCNGSENPSTCGTSTFYYHPWSKALASNINNRMSNLFSSTFYDSGQESSQGVNFYAFSVCRPTVCPSVLVETAFITNPGDCAILTNPENANKIAQAITEGIDDYLNSQS